MWRVREGEVNPFRLGDTRKGMESGGRLTARPHAVNYCSRQFHPKAKKWGNMISAHWCATPEQKMARHARSHFGSDTRGSVPRDDLPRPKSKMGLISRRRMIFHPCHPNLTRSRHTVSRGHRRWPRVRVGNESGTNLHLEHSVRQTHLVWVLCPTFQPPHRK